MSTFRATMTPDDPVADTARTPFDATARAEADARALASQLFLAECLIAGVVATYARIATSSAAVAKGDVLTRTSATTLTVTLATGAALAASGSVFGVALRAAAPGTLALVAIGGAVGPDITGLVTSGAVPVRVTNGRAEWVSSLVGGDYALGWADAGGWLTLGAIGAAGSGGGIVTAVTGVYPISSSGGATPAISIYPAASESDGYMSAADYNKLAAIKTGTGGQPSWTVGPAGLAASTLGTTYYELLWANRTGGTAFPYARLNGGRDGMALDATNYTTIALVARALDGTGGDTPLAALSNDIASFTAKADVLFPITPIFVADGSGIFVKITKTGTGTNISPGTRVYLTF